MREIDEIGTDWLVEQVEGIADHVDRVGPVEFNEETRYLPAAVTPRPGFIRYALFPYLREIIECFDPLSPVREVNMKKGVQTGYTTLLESIMLYYMGYIKTKPLMFITADKELATARIENNILPMLNESDLAHIIQTSDTGNSRKTGKTKDYIQWAGGGFMIPQGAQNAAKMRMFSVPLMLKDELDGWKREIGRDGNSDTLTDARLSAYWGERKILRGSTPLLEPSMIDEAYKKGDQRRYMVRCLSCGFPQFLRFETVDKESGVIGGLQWETEGGVLLLDSVQYHCANCGHAHAEHDKEKLFSSESGAEWKPTAKPREPGIRSYHLPALYSPFGFTPWSKCVADYLDAYDPDTKQTKSFDKYQTFHNNILGEAFQNIGGSKVRFSAVSAHRRNSYILGQVPNVYAAEWSGSPILFLTFTVDVHKRNLAATVLGWTRDSRCYLVDYWRFEVAEGETECTELSSPAWGRLRKVIEEVEYVADDGKRYRIGYTGIDARYANDTVVKFCGEYASGVVFILGQDQATRYQKIQEFAKFTTQDGTIGYRVTVDYYKDRLAPVLRREWVQSQGRQDVYHFNAPMNLPDAVLKELTVESKREKKDERTGVVGYYWHRPGGVNNELWDLLVYGHALVDIWAHAICIEHFELKAIDWGQFWDYAAAPENDAMFGRS